VAATEPEIDLPDAEAGAAARAALSGAGDPVLPLGELTEWLVWSASVQSAHPPRPFRRVRALLLAADHPPMGAPATPAADAVARVLAGDGAMPALAVAAGAQLGVVDVGVAAAPDDSRLRGARSRRIGKLGGRLDIEDVHDRATVQAAIDAGRALADAAADEGVDLLVPLALGPAELSATAVMAALTRTEPAAAVGWHGSDQCWQQEVAAVRDGLFRTRAVAGDPVGQLAALGGIDLAVTVGLLLRAAARHTPVLLDGPVAAAAALAAREVDMSALDWMTAADRGTAPATRLAFERLGLHSPFALNLRLGPGCGALAVLPLLQSALVVATDTVR
jgi:nicotinate-nucleotide--dimethylbenzimidazole phosphoribosyltransferase